MLAFAVPEPNIATLTVPDEMLSAFNPVMFTPFPEKVVAVNAPVLAVPRTSNL